MTWKVISWLYITTILTILFDYSKQCQWRAFYYQGPERSYGWQKEITLNQERRSWILSLFLTQTHLQITISQGIARVAAPSTFHVAKVDWEIPVKSKDDHLKALVRIDWISTKAIAFRWIQLLDYVIGITIDLPLISLTFHRYHYHYLVIDIIIDILSLIPSIYCRWYYHRYLVIDIIDVLSLIPSSSSFTSSSIYCHWYHYRYWCHHRYLAIDIILSLSSSLFAIATSCRYVVSPNSSLSLLCHLCRFLVICCRRRFLVHFDRSPPLAFICDRG